MNIRGHHIGIFALSFLALVFTIPSAFADEPDPFSLMEKITAGQEELATLESLITSNGLNMGAGLTEYADALDLAAEFASSEDPDDWKQAEDILDGSEDIVDDIFTQLYAQIDSRQNERFTEFVENAIESITFIVIYGDDLGISPEVVEELEITLAILEGGNYEQILAATSEDSDLGLTVSMFPDDHPGFGKASEVAKGTEDEPGKAKGKGIGLGDIENLPPGIKKQLGFSTDSNLSNESSDGIDVTNDDVVNTNDGNLDFFSTLPGYDIASEDGQARGQGQGVGLGVGPEAPGILKKDEDWLYDHGFIVDDTWEDSFEEDDFSKGKAKGKGKLKDCSHGKCAKGQDKSKGKGSGGPPDEPPGGGPPDEPPGGGPPDEPPGGDKGKGKGKDK